MTPERWEQVKELFEAALERQAGERASFLREACAGDQALRDEVEQLLAEHARAGSFIERPVPDPMLTANRPQILAKWCPKCGRSFPRAERFCPDDDEPLALHDPYHLVGRVLVDKYRLDALVGIGGMGAVYRAQHLAIDRRVALKILQPNLGIVDQRMIALFEREARAAGRVVHENISDVFDAGHTADGIAYIAMEWLDGATLEEEISIHGSLDLERASAILRQVAAALEAAHAAQVVHRDLKPSNIMLVRRPQGGEHVKVLDFGIAKVLDGATEARVSTIIGTPNYASPEQLHSGGRIDARTDIYSLGVVLYRMLSGALPFSAPSVPDLIRQKLSTPPPPIRRLRPDLPLALGELLDSMLDMNPNNRPQSPKAVVALFDRAVAGFLEDQGRRQAADGGPLPARLEPRGAPDARASAANEHARTDGNNPLLSELDALPRVQAWLRAHRGGGAVAAGAGLAGLIAALISRWAGSACIHVVLQAEPSGVQQRITFGYLAEPNAALWYVAGVPVFVIAAFHFLNLAYGALRELSEAERLTVWFPHATAATSPLEFIGKRNRRLFRVLGPALLLLAVAGVSIPEYSGGGSIAFGWVGAHSVKDYEGASLRRLQAEKKVGAIPELERLCRDDANCSIRVARVEGGHGRSEPKKPAYIFGSFLAVALGLQVLFAGFGFWMACKIVFFFATLTQALVHRSRSGLRVELDLEDTEMRFGLGALDVIYNIVLILLLLISVVFLLQRITNVAKGTSFFGGMAGLPLISQLGLFLSPLVLLILIVVVPMLLFMVLIETEVGRKIGEIERERAALRREAHAASSGSRGAMPREREELLRRKRDLVRQQRPWPRKSPVYRTLLVACLLFLVVLPFGIEFVDLPEYFPHVSRGMTRLSELLCWLV